MTTYSILRGNATYTFDPSGKLLWLADIGTGMAPIQRIFQAFANLDGAEDYGYVLLPRKIQASIAYAGHDWADYAVGRDLLTNIFKPGKTAISLRAVRDDGSLRQIDFHLSGGLSMDSANGQGATLIEAVELFCPEPTFYDPTRQFVAFSIGGGGSGFTVPITIPSFLGASAINTAYPVAYAGSYKESPICEITGPITDLVITQQQTGEVLDFTGKTISAGTTITLDTRPRFTSAKDQAGADQIAMLTDASDLSTFHLEPDPDAPAGLNSIKVTGTGVTTATIIYMRYFNRYIGG